MHGAYKCPLKGKNGYGNDRLMQMKTHANGFQRATMGTLAHLLAIYLYHVNGFRIATMRTTAAWHAQRKEDGYRMRAGGCALLTYQFSQPWPSPYYIYRQRNRDCPTLRCHDKGRAQSGQCLDSWQRRKRKSNGRDRRLG